MAALDRLDPKREREGIWLPYTPQPDAGMRVRVASMASDRYQRYLREHERERVRELHQTMPMEDAREAFHCEAVAAEIVLGWEGFDGQDGTPMECSPDTVAPILKDARYRRFKSWVLTEAMRDANFNEIAVLEAAKNSDAA